ncbi:hypothetical protein L596_012952 [Steinernema carpocapsae]|uniref:Enolase-phosphatase E1 n=1 Tax=Steinernema carpocapsae TaxID=34508 RepID=A0A4U5NYL8_STECR|nr:hypothetical protein L596_012952 [Steinernema carpocapsae]
MFEALVLDIEGTTSSISFVKDELFPYVYRNVESYLREKGTEETFAPLVALANSEAEVDANVGKIEAEEARENKVEKLTKNIKMWIDKDKKFTAMKQLQGQMWKDAYEQNLIKGQYPKRRLRLICSVDGLKYLFRDEKEARKLILRLLASSRGLSV